MPVDPDKQAESVQALRADRDALRAELDALKTKPMLPDDVLPTLATFHASDPTEGLRAALAAASETANLKTALQQKDVALQAHDITQSDVWVQQFVTPANAARERIIVALADARLDPATRKPVIVNQNYVDAAMAALIKANTSDPVHIKAVLTEEATKLNIPAPDSATLQAVTVSISQLSQVLAQGEQIKATWVSTKSQREAEALRKQQEQTAAQRADLLKDYDTHAAAIRLPGVDAASTLAAALAGKSMFTDILSKNTGVAASVIAKAALYDELIAPVAKMRADQKLADLKTAASGATPPKLGAIADPTPPTTPIAWTPKLASVSGS